MMISELKEAIADYGIDEALDICIELIGEGYLSPYHPPDTLESVTRSLQENRDALSATRQPIGGRQVRS